MQNPGGSQPSSDPDIPLSPGSAAVAPRPSRLAVVLRVFVGVLTLLVFIQAILAGQFIGGNSAGLDWHRVNGLVILLVAAAQLVPAIWLWRRNGPAWPAITTALLLVAVVIQLFLGFGNEVSAHVPLGVAIFGFAMRLAIGVGGLR
jgi:hypothetical protein